MKANADIFEWLKENLQEVLPFLVSDDIVKSVMSIEDLRDLEVFISTMIDTTCPKYQEFLAKYKKVRTLKDTQEDNTYECYTKQKSKKKGNSDNNLKDKKNDARSSNAGEIEKSSGQKKKTKYVNLYSTEGKQKDVILLKGRHLCECQASKHKLISNCLKCGRIVCEQEGRGPCLFCGSMVFSREDLAIINSNSKQSRKLYCSIMESFKSAELDKAVESRDKLLEYDKTFAQRTRVIDDEGEYYSSNSVWLSKEEREKLEKKEQEAHEKKHASRLKKKFTIDFAGRTVLEEDPEQFDEEFYAEAIDKIESSLTERYSHSDFREVMYESGDSAVDIKQKTEKYPKLGSKIISNRVQDRELLEMSDNGICLSLRQPWASLLVSGIMRYEGRTWYTSHRGRLWIASASKRPSDQDIKDAENFFVEVRAGENLNFPKSYPTGCLLGCVSVIDCLPQGEFRLKFPMGECDSPFVFICEDPRHLDTLFPVSGSHKMYKLDPKIHQAANKILLRMAKNSKS